MAQRLFGDRLFTATDLNRHGGKILDVAVKVPVTITRNDQYFAILRRDLASRMSAVTDQVELYVDIMTAIDTLRAGGSLRRDHPYHWLRQFDQDDWLEFSSELLTALASLIHGDNNEDAVEVVLHEWYESAFMAMTGALDEAMRSERDLAPLTEPVNSDRHHPTQRDGYILYVTKNTAECGDMS